MRALFTAALCGAALGACSPPTPESASTSTAAPSTLVFTSDRLTTQGWGPLKIGMTAAEVLGALGPNALDQKGAIERESCTVNHPEGTPAGLIVMMIDGKLARITASDVAGGVKTENGLGVGSSAAEVKAAYGVAAKAEPHKYQDKPAEYVTIWTIPRPASEPYVEDPAARGVRYEIGSDGKVQSIHAGDKSIQAVESCS